ncbi:polysaccharide deacetylase family protein [Modestobacter sp. URMC 112]
MTFVRGLRRRIRAPFHRGLRVVEDTVADVGRRVPGGAVALTFDDGPHPDSTPRVLDVLRRLDVQATFFCVGRNARDHPALVHRALDEGHAIGSHSWSHPHPAETPRRRLSLEYSDGREAVASVVGRDVPLFRPPHGHLSVGDALLMRRQRLVTWLWTVDPEDWRPGVSSSDIVSVASRAGSGDVVLLHDWVEQPWAPQALDRSATVKALPAIVEAVTGRGLHFVTLPA